MWPYMIRLNRTGVVILIFACVGIYFLYSASFSSSLAKSHLSHFQSETINMKQLLIACVKTARLGGGEVVRVREQNDLEIKSKGKTKEGVNDVLTQGDMRSHWAMVNGLSSAFTGLRIISEEHGTVGEEEKLNLDVNPIHVSRNDLLEEQYEKLPDDVNVSVGELTIWIDPLDATKEYSENLPQYVTTMVCVARNGRPIMGVIYKPFQDEIYWGWTGHDTSYHQLASSTTHKNATKLPFRVIVSLSHAGAVQKLVDSSFKEKPTMISAAGSGYKTIELIKDNADAYVHITVIKKWDICAANAILDAIEGGKMTTLKGESIDYNYDDESVINKDGILATIKKDHDGLLKMLSKHST